MNRLVSGFFKALESLIALLLLVMVVLVFSNVVLRYAFNSGITVSEELSRWCFIWMTFLGAVVALREHGHLGVDMLVQRLPPAGKRACLLLAHAVMLYIVALLCQGSWAQVRINADVAAPASGLPMAAMHAAALVFGVLAALVLAADLWRLLRGHITDDQLVMVRESEEALQLQQILGSSNDRDTGTDTARRTP